MERFSGVDSVGTGAAAVAEVWTELVGLWRLQTPDGFYRGRRLLIDLNNPEGRAQMLVLANLLAARVAETVAESTFLALGEAGLLDLDRLLEGSATDREKALDILRTTYRALTDKERKVEAIYRNQALLKAEWQGDLHNVYLAAEGDDEKLIETLQGFAHLRQRAFWLAREMKISGVWPRVRTHASAYYDVHIRRVLARLGFTRLGEGDDWLATRRECQEVVDGLFDGDVIPFYLHGSRLCVHDDRTICATSCPVKELCSFWQQGPNNDVYRSAD